MPSARRLRMLFAVLVGGGAVVGAALGTHPDLAVVHERRPSHAHRSLTALTAQASLPASAPVIGVGGRLFTLNGTPNFLLGVSVFDALGRVPPSDADLDRFRALGLTIVRVWAHWHEAIYAGDGRLTSTGRARLDALTRRLGERGLALELVVLRPGQLAGGPFAIFASPDARRRAVREVTQALVGQRHVFFDLFNEHDHRDGPVSHAELRALRDVVKLADPHRLVAVSSSGVHVASDTGVVDGERAANVRAEVGGDGGANADILAPHFPRTRDWSSQTAARVHAVRAVLDAAGLLVPIYLNEEQRARDGARVAPDEYLAAARGAKQAGAAGWVFHTGAGFDLGTRSFFDALTSDERQAIERLGPAVLTTR